MRVTERDRAYMQRIGTYKDASHGEAQARHLALPLSERLRRSWALFEACRQELNQPAAADPTPVYDRARALGLYRP